MQPSSVDVRCDHRFRVFHPGRYPFIDVKQPMPDLTELVEIEDGRPFILHPGEFVLGATLERISLPDDLVARLDGKSSLGRLGLQVHSTAGLADPGFTGQITLELSNMTRLPISLYPGMRVAQLVFEMLSTPADRPYGHGGLGSKYQGQSGRHRASTGATSSDDVVVERVNFCARPSHPGGRELGWANRGKGVVRSCVTVLMGRAEVLAARGDVP